MLAKRIIPCLDIKDGRVVKGVKFQNIRDAGDPIELAKFYCEEGADELVFLDISASKEKRKTFIPLVERIGREISIPFTVGGGIASVSDIDALLNAGADKISINTAAVKNPSLISDASKKFGAQCVVVAIDAKQQGAALWAVYINGGSENTSIDAVEWAKEAVLRGAGELLVTSIDRDGTKSGFDIELLQRISSAVSVPIVASGGAGGKADIKNAITEGGADAVIIASLLHNKVITIPNLKHYLFSNNIPVRI